VWYEHFWDYMWGAIDHPFTFRMGRKKTSQLVKSRGEFETQGLTIKEWQRTPKQLVSEFCQGQKRPRPLYKQTKGEGFRCRLVLPDPKGNSEKDIVLCTAESFETQVESEHAAALLGLKHVDGERQHEKRLPEPYRTAWLLLTGRKEGKLAPSKETFDFICEFCQKGFKKEHGLTIHVKREHAVEVAAKLELDTSEDEDHFDLFPVEDRKPVPITEPRTEFSVSSVGKFATKHEKRLHHEAKGELYRNAAKKREAHKQSNLYAAVMMSEQNRVFVEEVIQSVRTKSLKSSTNKVTEQVNTSLVDLGFRQEDILAAVGECEKSDTLLDWLCLHVEEKFLPKQFRATGSQFEVVQSVINKKRMMKALEGSVTMLFELLEKKTSFEGCSEELCCVRILDIFPELAVKYLEYNSWPLTADAAEDMSDIQQMRQDELLALEFILEGDNVLQHYPKFCTHDTDHEMDLYRIHVGIIDGIPGTSWLNVLVYAQSPTLNVYPFHPSIALFWNDMLTIDVNLNMTLELCKVAKNNGGVPQLYELWDTTRILLPEIVIQNPTRFVQSQKMEAQQPVPPSLSSSKKQPFKRRTARKPDNSVELKSEQASKKATNQAYIKMLANRENLPAYKFRAEVLNAINTNQVVLISGETGCGKTTQVPQFILDAAIEQGIGGKIEILCTQPRRLAAIGVAGRVSDERCESKLGDTIGYQIRSENKTSNRTRLTFLTTGILLRRLQGDPMLDGITHILVDEVHERNVDTDFLLAILASLMTKRKDLKIVLMSATLNADVFANYFNTKCVLQIPGFVHPVEDIFLEDVVKMVSYRIKADIPEKDALRDIETYQDYKLIANLVYYIDKTYPGGSILIFMSGTAEIDRTISAIGRNQSHLLVLPLHGGLSGNDQSRIFQHAPKGMRKVVVSTNVAETSITIDDVVFVIDSGKMKEMQFDPVNQMSMLVETWTSRDSARQRRGRAGRVRPGMCFKLYTSWRHQHSFLQSQLPEIHRVPLEQLLLQVLSIGLGQPHEFMNTLMEPPPAIAVDEAVKLLLDLGACRSVDSAVALSPLGAHMAKLPMNVRISKMLIYGSLLQCGDQLLTIAAALSTRSFFTSPNDKREEANAAKKSLLGDIASTQSDHLCLLYAFERFQSCTSMKDQRAFAEKYFLSIQSLKEVGELKRDFKRTLKDIGFDGNSSAAHNENGEFCLSRESVTLVKAALCAGLYPNIINVKKPLQKFAETSGGAFEVAPEARQLKMMLKPTDTLNRVFLHPSSVNFHQRDYQSPWLVFREKVKTSKVFIRDSTSVSPYGILLFGGADIVVQHENSILIVDGWIHFRAQARIGVLIRELRKLLDDLLTNKIDDPSLDISSTQLMVAIKNLIIGAGF